MDGRNRAKSESKQNVMTQERIKLVKQMLSNEQKATSMLSSELKTLTDRVSTDKKKIRDLLH